MTRLILTTAIATLLCPIVSHAAEWGDVKVKFVYDGKAPAAVALKANKDPFCIKQELVVEDLLVDEKTKGIRDVVLFIDQKSSDAQPSIHEDYKKKAEVKIEFDNQKCRFVPHILPLMVSQTLLVKNSDPIGHNTNIQPFTNPGQNFNLPAGAEVPHKFEVPESAPVSVSCSIHPWMKSYVILKDHPYVMTSSKEGEIVMKNVPVGTWRFRVWQEKSGYLNEVKGLKVDKRGRFEVTVKSGENDLGTILCSPKNF